MGSITNTDVSEPEWSIKYRNSHDAPYWLTNIDDKITLDIRRILMEYSNVPAEEITEHVYATREKLWKIRSYPCTGLGFWLNSELANEAQYLAILARVKAGARFVDIGAFMGYDLRRLVLDGAPMDDMFGVDIVSHWDVGFDFFRDRGRFQAKFIDSDLLNPNPDLESLMGTVDVVHIAHVFHQWPRAVQVLGIRRLLELTRPGAMISGEQAGSTRPRTVDVHNGVALDTSERPEVHSAESWRILWKEVSESMGVVIETDVKLERWPDRRSNEMTLEAEMMKLEWVVTKCS